MAGISLHYLNGPGSGSGVEHVRQAKNHTVAGPLSINWGLGDMAVVSATADIIGLADSNRPTPGYVTLKIVNVGATDIDIDLSGTDLVLAEGIPTILAPDEPIVLFGIEV